MIFAYILIAALFLMCACLIRKDYKLEERVGDLEKEATYMKLEYKSKYKTVENDIANLGQTMSDNYKDFIKMFDAIEEQCDVLINKANDILEVAKTNEKCKDEEDIIYNKLFNKEYEKELVEVFASMFDDDTTNNKPEETGKFSEFENNDLTEGEETL